MSILTALQITKKVARLTASVADLRRRMAALECPPRAAAPEPVPTEEPDPEAAFRRKKRR